MLAVSKMPTNQILLTRAGPATVAVNAEDRAPVYPFCQRAKTTSEGMSAAAPAGEAA